MDTLGVLLMVKNEEASISMTIDSTKDYIKHVIVYDTGSTDKTIEIIRETCNRNNRTLHLKQGTFEGFPESRNVSLDFAESVPVKFLLLMDAGDEFRCDFNPAVLMKNIDSFTGNVGAVRQVWNNEHHVDIRLIRNRSGMRYNLDYPVHEQINIIGTVGYFASMFYLYQCRITHGGSTEKRYVRDIELLLKAKPCKRNYFFLAQSYMSINDYRNGYKYNIMAIGQRDDDGDDSTSYSRAGFCAIQCGMSEQIIKHNLLTSIKMTDDPVIDSYIYLLDYYMKNSMTDKAIEYIDDIARMTVPKSNKTVDYDFYDYKRWYLISVVCLMANRELEKGYEALKKIIHFGKSHDVSNLAVYQRLLGVSTQSF
jgi:glycosyltransferase involved in cell wall biosynthesis